MPSRDTYERRAVKAACAAVLIIVPALAALVTVTRPVDRERLPRKISELTPYLSSLHPGPGPCARWLDDQRLSPDQTADLAADLSNFAALDLHVLLPILSHLRVSNHSEEAKKHPRTPREEVVEAALRRLSRLDRLRLKADSQNLDEIMPLLQTLDDDAPRLSRDRRRASFFMERLTWSERKRLSVLLQKWGHALLSPAAQMSIIHHVGLQNTLSRMRSIDAGLASYRDHYGRYPGGLRPVLDHMEKTNRIDPTLWRGRERDGSVRDGWLRPLTYYTRGPDDYRLISSGLSINTEGDDIVSSPTSEPQESEPAPEPR